MSVNGQSIKTHRHDFSEVGLDYARGWGQTTTVDRTTYIQSLDAVALMKCLLAAAVDALDDIRRAVTTTANLEYGNVRELRRIADAMTGTPARRPDPVADGFLAVLNAKPGLPAWTRLDDLSDRRAGLSVRARRTLEKLGADATLADVTPVALANLNNCGPTTTRELMEWKAGLLGGPVVPGGAP